MEFIEFLERCPSWQFNWLARQKREIFHALFRWKAHDFIRQADIEWRLNCMAGSLKKQRTKRTTIEVDEKPSFLPTKWVSVSIRNLDDQAKIREFVKDVDHILDLFVILVDTGYDISIKRDSRGKPVAYGFLPVLDKDTSRAAVSANGADALVALSVLIYKLTVKMKEENFSPEPDDTWEFS